MNYHIISDCCRFWKPNQGTVFPYLRYLQQFVYKILAVSFKNENYGDVNVTLMSLVKSFVYIQNLKYGNEEDIYYMPSSFK